MPRMYALFRTMEQDESMQIGDNLWAFLGRAVIQQFAVGHEIKQGPYAGRDIYMWNPKVNEDVRGFFEGRLGLLDVCTNFDFKGLFPYPEIKMRRSAFGMLKRDARCWPSSRIITPAPWVCFASVSAMTGNTSLLQMGTAMPASMMRTQATRRDLS